ncbi:MAG: ABC transporter ATP-binding protein [Pirellulaceae bacterium]|nr:ABC transporter ATP-binding protein [Pirellulaceae bacterium]
MTVVFDNGVRALDNVTMSVPTSEIVSLIGPSGCGKTTLLNVIAKLQPTTSGEVVMDPPAAGSRGEIAFVFQQPALLPWRTAIENVMLPLELIGHGTPHSRREAATEMLRTVHLDDAMDRVPSQLSGGMKMRVSIARALVTRPSLLLLDEPFAALDDMLRNELGQLLLELWEAQQFTAVLVTHNIAEAIQLSHKIVVMHDGRIGHGIDNPLARPRGESLRRSAEFGVFYGKISDALRAGGPDWNTGGQP